MVVAQFGQTSGSSQPDSPGGIFHAVEDVDSTERVWGDERREVVAVHARQTAPSANQEIAVAGLADGKDLIEGQAVAGSKGTIGGPAVEEYKAAIVKSNPDAAGVVLEDDIGLVAGQTLGLAIHREDI